MERLINAGDITLRGRVKLALDNLAEELIADDSTSQGVGLYRGLSGSMLFISQLYQDKPSEIYLGHLYKRLDLLMEVLDNKGVDGWNFSGGLAGCGWLIQYLADQDIIDPDVEQLLSDFDSALEPILETELRKGNIDQLNGAIGVGRYFLKRKRYDQVKKIIRHLLENKVAESGEYKWQIPDWQDKSLFLYNFSLSHGASGIVIFLIDCLKKGICKKDCLELIKGAVTFLLNNRQDIESGAAFFPNSYKVNEYSSGKNKHQNGRLAWCYGDLGSLYALYKASVILDDEPLKKNILTAYLHIADQVRSDILLSDAGFCHGVSGVAYMFLKMYHITGHINFKESAEFWLNKTFDFEGKDGHKFLLGNLKERAMKKDLSLLEGSGGLAMVYLVFLNPSLSGWDECVLLN